jgi:putative redox protein
MRQVAITGAGAGLAQSISVGSHAVRADEPVDIGGGDSGPTPHELLLSALGACTAITLRLYAARKGWPLTDVTVRVTGRHEDSRFVIDHELTLVGDLDAEQRARLMAIASRCPVHRTLTGTIAIETREA